MTKCGRAATTAQERRKPPETGVPMDPPPSVGIPRMITAASTNVAASAMNKTFVDLGNRERIPQQCRTPVPPPASWLRQRLHWLCQPAPREQGLESRPAVLVVRRH